MKKPLLIAISSLIILIILGTLAWYLTSSRSVNESVEKDFPSTVSEEALVQMAEKGQLATAAAVVEIATARPDPVNAAAAMRKHRSLAPACKGEDSTCNDHRSLVTFVPIKLGQMSVFSDRQQS